MNISKSRHLTILLTALYVTLSCLVFVVAVDVTYFVGRIDANQVVTYAGFLPVIVVLNGWCFHKAKYDLSKHFQWRPLRRFIRYFALSLGGLLTIAFLLKLSFLSRFMILGYTTGTILVIVATRSLLSWWYFEARRERPENYIQVLVVGSGPRAHNAVNTLREHSQWGIRLVGAVDPDVSRVGTCYEGLDVIGSVENVGDILSREVVDEVVIALPRNRLNDLDPLIEVCEEQAICVRYFADLYDMRLANVRLDLFGDNIPVLNFEPVSQDVTGQMIKRIFDLVVTLVAMPFLLVFFAIVAIAIKLDSPGPVFFRQPRVGLHKRRFNMIKFRSMHKDAEARLGEIEHLNEAEGPIFKIKDDPRVTRVGKFIRKTSIDELPQLFNVLLGDMSLVGPRPMSERDVSLFDLNVQRRRFSVRPGLACLREVSGRSALSFERWLELDLQYIEEWSLALDFWILIRLVPAVLKGDGAV